MFKDTVKIMGLWRKLAMTSKLQEDFLNIFHIQDSAKKKKKEQEKPCFKNTLHV